MKLFMFYVGGSCGGSNVELHDVRFSVGETAEACFDDLRRQWWGRPESLHLDAWGAIEQADGHDVEVTTDAAASTASGAGGRLFFANMRGYDPAASGYGVRVRLSRASVERPFAFECDYRPIALSAGPV